MSEPVRAVLAGGAPAFADAIAAGLPVAPARVSAAELERGGPLTAELSPHGLAWIHLVPSLPSADGEPLAEASLLLRSAHAARAVADRGGVPVTFVAVLPSPGMFGGATGLACDLALGALTSLMRTQIGIWSGEGRRIAGIVHAGIVGSEPAGQRPLEEIRRRTPMTVLGTFGQLADALRFVCSQRASYLTGTLLRVDGGCDAYSWVYPTRTI